MDWQYFPHKHIIDLEKEFESKGSALRKLKSMGLDCEYISSSKSYEQLYRDEVEKYFDRQEVDYLKSGILQIYECLKVIENEVPLTEDGEIKLIIKQNWESLVAFRKSEHFGEKEELRFIGQVLEQKKLRESKAFKESISALSKELAEFKVRLSRFGVTTFIDNDEIEFLEGSIPEPEFKMIDVIEKEAPTNTYPEIFRDAQAFVLFERLHSVFKNTKQPLADYSFIYRQMAKDGFILDTYKPEKFRQWIGGQVYDITTDAPFKTMDNCWTQLKQDLYDTLKNIQ